MQSNFVIPGKDKIIQSLTNFQDQLKHSCIDLSQSIKSNLPKTNIKKI